MKAIEVARAELAAEKFRAEVERHKARLRAARWWHRLFPWVISISITRRDA